MASMNLDSFTATYFEVLAYVEADRSDAFVVQRTTYYTSDGHISERELCSPSFATRDEAEAYARRMDASYPGA